MTRDEIVVAALVVAFASLLTLHVTIAAGLAARPPRWRAVVALIVPPLAPLWGARAGMRRRAIAWVVAAIAYVALRIVARR